MRKSILFLIIALGASACSENSGPSEACRLTDMDISLWPPEPSPVDLPLGAPIPLVPGADIGAHVNLTHDCSQPADAPAIEEHWTVDNTNVLGLRIGVSEDPGCPGAGLACRVVFAKGPGRGTLQAKVDRQTASRSFAVPVPDTYATIRTLAGGDPRCLVADASQMLCWGSALQSAMPSPSTGHLGQCWYSGAWCSPSPVRAGGQTSLAALDLTPVSETAHGCGIDPAGLAYCWGWDSYATGSTAPSGRTVPSPRLLTGGSTYTRIATGFGFSCALSTGGQAHCWGIDRHGVLGNDLEGDSGTPTPVTSTLSFIDLDIGGRRSCGVTTDGRVACWGELTTGTPGTATCSTGKLNTTPCSQEPLLLPEGNDVPAGTRFTRITVGTGHACVLAQDGGAYCFGSNEGGQLGAGNSEIRIALPFPVAGGIRFTSISAGGSHTCGVATDGTAWCWGDGTQGQLGSGSKSSSLQPVRVTGGLLFDSVVAGDAHSCGLGRDGNAYCWGNNREGALGNASQVDQAAPTRVTGRVNP